MRWTRAICAAIGRCSPRATTWTTTDPKQCGSRRPSSGHVNGGALGAGFARTSAQATLAACAREGRDFPVMAALIVPKHIDVSVLGVDFEPALRWRKPAVDN